MIKQGEVTREIVVTLLKELNKFGKKIDDKLVTEESELLIKKIYKYEKELIGFFKPSLDYLGTTVLRSSLNSILTSYAGEYDVDKNIVKSYNYSLEEFIEKGVTENPVKIGKDKTIERNMLQLAVFIRRFNNIVNNMKGNYSDNIRVNI